jgi:hypothetical protein
MSYRFVEPGVVGIKKGIKARHEGVASGAEMHVDISSAKTIETMVFLAEPAFDSVQFVLTS